MTARGVRAGCVAVWSCLLLFAGLMTGAIALYPGGTWLDPATRGHRFWANYWSDLLHPVAIGGAPNPVGSMLGAGGVLAMVAALLVFWWVAPELFPSRRARGWVRALGSLSVAGMLTVPSALAGVPHEVAIALAVLPGLGALVLTVLASRRTVPLPVVVLEAALLLAVVVDGTLYARDVALGFGPLAVTPALQKVATGLLVAWLIGCTTTLWRRS